MQRALRLHHVLLLKLAQKETQIPSMKQNNEGTTGPSHHLESIHFLPLSPVLGYHTVASNNFSLRKTLQEAKQSRKYGIDKDTD